MARMYRIGEFVAYGGLALLLMLSSCENGGSRREHSERTPRGAAQPSPGRPVAPPPKQPTANAPNQPPAGQPPGAEPSPQEAGRKPTTGVPGIEIEPPANPPMIESPDFVTVLDREDPAKPARVSARLEAPDNRLVLETRNVRRVRIDRTLTGADPSRSVALQLDGQPIEWTRNSKSTEFERSVNGLWSVAKDEPARPLRR